MHQSSILHGDIKEGRGGEVTRKREGNGQRRAPQPVINSMELTVCPQSAPADVHRSSTERSRRGRLVQSDQSGEGGLKSREIQVESVPWHFHKIGMSKSPELVEKRREGEIEVRIWVRKQAQKWEEHRVGKSHLQKWKLGILGLLKHETDNKCLKKSKI